MTDRETVEVDLTPGGSDKALRVVMLLLFWAAPILWVAAWFVRDLTIENFERDRLSAALACSMSGFGCSDFEGSASMMWPILLGVAGIVALLSGLIVWSAGRR